MKTRFKKARTLLLSMVVLLGTGLSAQTTYTVSSDEDNGEGTLRQIIEEAFPGDSIVIPGDYTISLMSEIAFDKSLAINGQGALVKVMESGVSPWRVFSLGTTTSSPRTVSMYNLRLEGGNINAFGAVIYVRINHTFTMKNCTISKGKGTYAGGMFVHKEEGTSITLEDCIISDNEATTANGGAVILRGVFKVNNCTFKNNKSDLNGAGIACYDVSPGSLISNCRFIGNMSHAPSGGAIINYSGQNSVDLENCTFESNTNTPFKTYVTGAGGFAIASANGKSTLTNCTFYNNTGTTTGAVFNGKGTLNLVNCTFAGNSTPSEIGAGGFHDINHADAKTTMVNNLFAYNYNAQGLMDVFVRPLSTLTGSNNLIGEMTDSDSKAVLENTINYSYNLGYSLFDTYSYEGDQKPVLETNGTVRLAQGSVAMNAGLKTYDESVLIPLKDQLGNIRPATPSCGSVEFVPFSVLKNTKEMRMTISLDPTTYLLSIKGEGVINKVDLIDMSGRRALSVNNPTESIALNGLSKGVYLVRVFTSKGDAVSKININ